MKARTMYDNVLRLVDDPDVREPIKFLRAREVVHYQRFAEALGIAQDRANCKTNFYLTNPSFDKNCAPPCPSNETCRVDIGRISAATPNATPNKSYTFEIKRPF
jgi:Mn-containing catalase